MLISRQHIRQVSAEFLRFLDNQRITSYLSLENMLDGQFPLQNSGSFMEIRIRPSVSGTKALTISYVQQGLGIPLELKLNLALIYSEVILKMQEVLQGYAPFAQDVFGNLAQFKLIPTCEFAPIRQELDALYNA